MKEMKRFSIMAILAMAALCSVLSSCKKERIYTEARAIGFEVNCKTTKAAPITTGSITADPYGEFYSVAFTSDGKYYSATDGTVKAEYSSITEDETTAYYWTTGQFWPETDIPLDFWSFAPVSEFDPAQVSFASGHSTMTFTYSPARDGSRRMDATDQQDLIVAYSGQQHYSDNSGQQHRVPVTFNHALSAIRFKVGTIDPYFTTKGITDFTISSVSLNNIVGKGSCTVTETADLDANRRGISQSNMTVAWTPSTEATDKTSYMQIFNADFSASDISTDPTNPTYLDQIAGKDRDGNPIEGGIFMVIPQVLAGASLTLNWGCWEDVTDDGVDNPEFIQRTARTTELKTKNGQSGIKLEAGYIYEFTINIVHRHDGPEDPDPDDEEADIYVVLSEKIPWDYVKETKDYSDIVTVPGSPMTFSNYSSMPEGTRQVIVYQYPQELVCNVRISSPKGAKLLVKIEQEFDAFTYEFETSDQVPEEGDGPIVFRLKPKYQNPEREYVAGLSLSLRLVNGRIVNIDGVLGNDGDNKYKIILPEKL